LSTLAGRLSVSWEDDDGLLRLIWREEGGPPVRKPTSQGFGTRSVLASIESQLGGRADFDWRSEGLLCRLAVPLAAPAAIAERAAMRQATVERAGSGR
jgi:two-component sensor histidine kinase